jgi:hypothetical protein
MKIEPQKPPPGVYDEHYYRGERGPDVGDDPGWAVDVDGLYALTGDQFHVGQGYEKKAAREVGCAICGGREFNVGAGSYYTAIRCVSCRWEVCFHDG